MNSRISILFTLVAVSIALTSPSQAFPPPSEKQLAQWLKRFPKADTNKDGKLSWPELKAYKAKLDSEAEVAKLKESYGLALKQLESKLKQEHSDQNKKLEASLEQLKLAILEAILLSSAPVGSLPSKRTA